MKRFLGFIGTLLIIVAVLLVAIGAVVNDVQITLVTVLVVGGLNLIQGALK